MKKSLWMLGVAVAALTSCTQSEVLDVPESRTIGFDSFVGKQTRADVINDAAFNDFVVYGAKGSKSGGVFTSDASDDNTQTLATEYYLNNVHVTRTNANSAWTYSPVKEWVFGKYYRFAAYSDGHNDAATTDAAENEYAKVTFNPNFETQVKVKNDGGQYVDETVSNMWGLRFDDYTAGTNDLIAATSMERNTVSTNTGHNSVNFSFVHMLAKVQFKFSYFTSDDADNTTVYILPFTLKAIKTADCDIFHYHGSNAEEMTYVNWASQFVKPTDVPTAATDVPYIVDNYQYFPGTSHTLPVENGGQQTVQATKMDKNTPVFYNNYVIPQCNDFTISNITVLVYKGDKLSSAFEYDNISLKIENHEYWKPGYVYRYEANLNASKQYIEFTANVENWIDTPD